MEPISSTIQENSDEALVQKIVAGETALFEVLIRRHNSAVYKIARSYGFNHQDAEDLMQETHFAAYTHLKQFAFKASYKTWLSKIMIHKCLYKLSYGHGKKEQPNSELVEREDIPLNSFNRDNSTEAAILRKEFSNILEHSLQHLPVAYRMVFILREMEGFSIADTAELLAITPVNVKVRLNRAKTMLQKSLEQYYKANDVYEFNLVYCNAVVQKVFERIKAGQ
jgi:RNA polymerase sigma-70 factor (ECF subfamily)